MAQKHFDTRIQWKRDTSSNWTANNPVLLNGEIIIVDTDNGEIRFKIGDGVKTYTQLPFEDEAIRNLINEKINELSTGVAYINSTDNETIENPDVAVSEIIVDSSLSTISVNPVQNKVITQELNTLSEATGERFEKVEKAIGDLLPKNQGAANAGKILVVGTDGNLVLTDMPEGGASGDVVGVFDENKNILLSGNIAVGTYTLMFKNSDGTYTGSGTLEVTEIVPEPAYNNLADPTSADWQEGYRLSVSSGSTSPLAGHTVTNYIRCTNGDILRVKGMMLTGATATSDSSNSAKIVAYNSSKTKLDGLYGDGLGGVSSANRYDGNVSVNGEISTYTVLLNNDGTQKTTGIEYIRIDGMLMDGYTKNDVIITINEEITE